MPIYTVHKVKNMYYIRNNTKKWYKQTGEIRFGRYGVK